MNSYSLESSVGSIQNTQTVDRHEQLLGAPGSIQARHRGFQRTTGAADQASLPVGRRHIRALLKLIVSKRATFRLQRQERF